MGHLNKAACVIFGVIVAVAETSAQLSLPQFDLEVKGGYAKVDAGKSEIANNVDYTMMAGALHVQISQRIAVGGFYSRGLSGNVEYVGNPTIKYPLSNLSYGIDLRFSGGRSARWRPFISLVYGKAEFVQKTGTVNLSGKTDMMGVDAGVMLRLGRNLYWKVIEVSPRYLPDKIHFIDADFLIEGKMGLLYNIRLKTK